MATKPAKDSCSFQLTIESVTQYHTFPKRAFKVTRLFLTNEQLWVIQEFSRGHKGSPKIVQSSNTLVPAVRQEERKEC